MTQGQQRPGFPQQQLQQLFGAGYTNAAGAGVGGLGGLGSSLGYGQQSLGQLLGQSTNFNNLNLVNPLLLRRQYRYGRREASSDEDEAGRSRPQHTRQQQQQREASRHQTWTNKIYDDRQ